MELFIDTKEFLEKYEEYKIIEEGKWYQAMYDGGNTPYPDISVIDETLWLHSSEYYLCGAQVDYQVIFHREIKELIEKGIYFLYCRFNTYEKTYQERLNKFLETYEDAFPVHFLEDELKTFIKPINENAIYCGLESKYKVDFSFTIDRCISYLVEEQARKIGYAITTERDGFDDIVSYKIEVAKNEKESISINETPTLQSLKWQGTELQLTELIKALKESNFLNPELSQKEIFIRFKSFMQVENFNEADKIKEITKRTKDKTPLLNILETSLNNYIHKKD